MLKMHSSQNQKAGESPKEPGDARGAQVSLKMPYMAVPSGSMGGFTSCLSVCLSFSALRMEHSKSKQGSPVRSKLGPGRSQRPPRPCGTRNSLQII